MKKIVFDVMGSDAGPSVAVAAASQFAKRHADVEFVLVGQQNIIKNLLVRHPIPSPRCQIIDAQETVAPTIAHSMEIRHADETSLMKALRLIKNHHDYAFMLTPGPTGGLVAGTALTFADGHVWPRHLSFLGLLPGLDSHQQVVALDLGAVLQVKPETLLYYAKVGNLVCQQLLNRAHPRIGLLNVGTEVQKGLPFHVKAYQMLQDDPSLNFIGNVEPHMVLAGVVDVVVCDGYGGNIALKSIVGVVQTIQKLLTNGVKSCSGDAKNLGQILKPLFKISEFAGLVVGVPSLIFKSAGRSEQTDFLASLEYGYKLSDSKIKKIIGNLAAV